MRYPWDVGGISRDSRVTTKLGISSLHQAVSTLTPEDFRLVVDTKLSGSDGFKPCHVECKGTEKFKCTSLLAELMKLNVHVAAVRETHFICAVDCWVLENDFNVFSA